MNHFRLILVQRFTGDCIPVLPLIGLLLYSYGLTLSDVSLFFLILALSVVLTEIPTGFLTDKTSAKIVLVLSRLLKLIAFVILLVFPGATGAYIAAALWGTSTAADSGAFQSYLYRSNKDTNESYERVYSQGLTASLVGLLVGAALASQIAILGYEILQIIGIAMLCISLIATLILPQQAQKQITYRGTSSPESTQNAYRHLSFVLILLLTIGALAGGIKGSLDEYTAIMLSEKTEIIALVGYIVFALEVIRTTGAMIAGRITLSRSAQAIILACLGVAFMLVAVANVWIAFLLLVLILLFDAIVWVHNDASIQHLANDTNRATLASYKNFGTELLGGMLFALVWLFGDSISIPLVYQVSGGLLVVSGIIIWLLLKPRETAS